MIILPIIALLLFLFSFILVGFGGSTAFYILPFGVDALLSTGVGYYHTLAVWIPPLEIMLNGFLVILCFKLIMFGMRLFKIFT